VHFWPGSFLEICLRKRGVSEGRTEKSASSPTPRRSAALPTKRKKERSKEQKERGRPKENGGLPEAECSGKSHRVGESNRRRGKKTRKPHANLTYLRCTKSRNSKTPRNCAWEDNRVRVSKTVGFGELGVWGKEKKN